MVLRPKAKQDANRRFLPTKATAKWAIVSPAWGQLVSFTTYKAVRQGKLVIPVPPEYSSQECAVSTFIHFPGQSALTGGVCLSTLWTHRSSGLQCGCRYREAGYQKASFRQSAHEISQNHADFSEVRAGAVRSSSRGDRTRRGRPTVFHAAVNEPGIVANAS